MRFLPILLVAALLVLSVALGLHCLVGRCDRDAPAQPHRRSPGT